MNIWKMADMPWLLPPPTDFREHCTTLLNKNANNPETGFRTLANLRLDLDQLTLLARRWKKVRQTKIQTNPLTPFRLGVVSNATTGMLIPCLEATALRYGINLDVITSDFGQVMQEAINPESHINQAKPDAILLALDHRGLPFSTTFPDSTNSITSALDHVRLLQRGFRKSANSLIIVQTIAPPPESLFGNFDFRQAGTLSQMIHTFNQRLPEILNDGPDLLLDVNALAASVGLDSWHDPLQWNMARLAFSQHYVPLYADHVARIIAAVRGKSKKCLVLDLDNTLWGGVIGDDGLDGITLGQGDPKGESFLNIQRWALALRQRGIILAVCSKNEEKTARLPFQQHPEMILKEEHIAVFQANWIDKASNLKNIAKNLNIGLDALVLLDDNPVERAQVRASTPDVAVPELPEDPALFSRTLLAAGYFEAVNFTQDDSKRAEQYQANSNRQKLQESTLDLNDFLNSLQMEVDITPFDATGRQRITQLTNKTNQFNCTTRRYTQSQIQAMEKNSEILTLQVRLKDRFGDNGIISVLICRNSGLEWEIDTWLMSCRVLNRRVEEAVFSDLVRRVEEHGGSTLLGRFIPSQRNGLIKNLFAKLGFQKVEKNENGTLWRFSIHPYQPPKLPMVVTYS